MEKYVFSEDRRSLLEGMQVPFAIYQFLDKRVVTLILSDGFCRLLGYEDRAEAYYDMDHHMYKDAHPDDVARIAGAAVRFATEGGSYEAVYRSRRKGSSDYVIIHARGEHVITDTGVRLAQVWYTDEGAYTGDATVPGMSELTDSLSNALHEQSLVKASHYDFLTGLPNMTYFFDLADSGKEIIRRRGDQPVLLYMDLSGMKFFNSKHGFAEGDRMLRSFAQILTRPFSHENCCRIGADHFAVIAGENGLEDLLRQIFREFGDLYEGQTPPVHVGIYPYRLEDAAASTACDRAKLACTALRGSYSSAFHIYNDELSRNAVLKQYVIENIDTAIRENWIQVYYQPIIRSVNELVCDEEALARWIDPVRGFMSPAAFIPALEESGLIYKLDLYMLEQVLRDMQTLKAEGIPVVPHSINLSRSDFDMCDIVEEIRARADAAGIPHSLITIEITESIIGSDFDFIKTQIARFRRLGFPVWMDDFGSGYSSLEVLQSIRFDLLKFDMSFMRRLDESENAHVVLTELMKMASAMGLDTVCEGVETESQARFLKEIGCSKLQGFYYEKPNPFSHILEWHRKNGRGGYENPAESAYYDSIGRVNLYDLDVIAQGDTDSVRNAFDTLPMGLIEIRGDSARFLRSNQSYRNFISRFYGMNLSDMNRDFKPITSPFMHHIIRNCCERGIRSFFDEKMPDGSIVHSFARRISTNPVTGSMSVAVAVLSVSAADA